MSSKAQEYAQTSLWHDVKRWEGYPRDTWSHMTGFYKDNMPMFGKVEIVSVGVDLPYEYLPEEGILFFNFDNRGLIVSEAPPHARI